jgi:hypothetical protein
VTHQFLIYADDVHILGNYTNTIKNKDTLIGTSNKIGLEVNTEKTMYMLMSDHQNAG